MGIELTDDQVYAIYDLEHWWNQETKQVFEISGSPGSGKSFLIRYFIERLGLKEENVLFLAFMGKAAAQLRRNGLPGKTIHSVIYDYKEKVVRDEEGKVVLTEKNKPKLEHFFEKKEFLPKKIKLIVIDEASMVDEKLANDILSFQIPVVALGDLNQLPPVFGKPYFLKNPDVILRKIMRQKEGDPIVWLSQQVLHEIPLRYGVYGKSFVIPKKDITEFHFRKADMIITGTNRLRYNINKFCREEIKQIKKLEYPHIGEKIICRKNNWNCCIGKEKIYLMNGMTGFVDNIHRGSFRKRSMKLDFRPDFTNKVFYNLEFDYNHLYKIPGGEEKDTVFSYFYDRFEFSYAITVHSCQGSQWPYVLYMHENFMKGKEDNKKLMYTAITRAENTIGIVL